MTLTLLPRAYDLPPRWDDRDVAWGPWHDAPSSLRFHLPPEQQACTECGLIAEPIVASGLLHSLPGETIDIEDVRTLPSGRTYVRGEITVRAWPYVGLTAFRCTGCEHDHVHEERTGESWDLDASDYGSAGSVEVKDTLW